MKLFRITILGLIATGCSIPNTLSGGPPAAQQTLSPVLAPSPSPPPPDFFPLVENATWQYDAFVNSVKVGQATTKVTLVKTEGAISTAHWRTNTVLKVPELKLDRETVQNYTLKKLPDEVQATDSGGYVGIWLKLPLKDGMVWVSGGEKTHVQGQEDISTPYGAIRGAYKLVNYLKGATSYTWYADKLGAVKTRTESEDGLVVELELTSISGLPKEEK